MRPVKDFISEQDRYQSNLLLLSELARSRRTYILKFILRRVNNASEAEDIVQQTFIEAINGLKDFRSESQLCTWLYGIASNLVSKHLCRSPQCVYRWESEDFLESSLDYSVESDGVSVMRNLLGRIRHHVETLPEEMKITLLMVVEENKPYTEVAEVLGIPVGTVRSRIWRARSILYERLAEENIDQRDLIV